MRGHQTRPGPSHMSSISEEGRAEEGSGEQSRAGTGERRTIIGGGLEASLRWINLREVKDIPTASEEPFPLTYRFGCRLRKKGRKKERESEVERGRGGGESAKE
jgi:hypothetical protein